MTLSAGTRLGPYEILSAIGAGGMGEVYRAKDTRLDRTVAIKVLPSGLASSPEQRQRFEREARMISKLSHPHICALHDVGRDGETEYLVMEYLEGQTLADRLAKGALPLEQTVRYGTQIADALDKAHRQGIVHRDLKPGNVMLTKSGVKLLDFGLAKAMAPEGLPSDLTSNPTAAPRSDLTQEGTLLGTLPYMAPEQLEGKEADSRTDIFALGATLYEMASGRKAFSGSSRASLISSILRDQPKPVSQFEPSSPPALDRIIGTCLAKNPDERWNCAHDVGRQLVGIAEAANDKPEGSVRRRKGIDRIPPIAAAVLVGALAWVAGRYFRQSPAPPYTRKLAVLPPAKASLVLQEAPAISPDGRRLAFVAVDPSGKSLLYVRALESLEAAALSDTESASMPFWSPDSRSLGFFAKGKLKTIEVAGGHSQTLCDAPVARGGTWNQEGTILFVRSPPEPPYVVSASGGEARPVPSLAGTTGVAPYRRSPYFLPDGRHYLYLSYDHNPDQIGISVGSLDSKESKHLVASRSTAAYAPPGYLLFRRETALMAQRFDPDKLELRGEPFPIVPDVGFNPLTLHTLFSVSKDGTLAYVSAGAMKTRLIWYGRDGKVIGSVGLPAFYNSLSLSPDEKRVAVDVASQSGDIDIWTLDLERGIPSRFTFSPTIEFFPIWSPDGTRIAFAALHAGPPNLYQKVTSGAGADERLLETAQPSFPASWSRDGRFLVFASLDPKTKWDIWALPTFGDRRPFPFAQSEFDELMGEISPDGHWMAYVSNESGNFEVYVRPFPSGAGKWQVSRDGGYGPQWRGDMKELFYLSGNGQFVAVEVRVDPTAFEVGSATALFTARLTGIESQNALHRYAVSADGQRFLVNTIGEDANATPITLTLNWNAGLPK